MEAVELKAKKKGGKDKSALSKAVGGTGLLSHVNENVNMFSQLSAMYLSKKTDQSEEVKDFLEKTEEKQVFTQHSYDPEIQQCLNQMAKKSQITKLKALAQLRELLEKQPEEFFDQFAGTWTYLYKQFVNSEHDRKVFEEINAILIVIIQRNRKCLQPQFKDLFPYWFIQMSDPSPDVSGIATAAFEKMFPKEKQSQAFSVCSEKYLLNLKYYLGITLKQIESENNNIGEHEAQDIYDRLVVSSLNSITKAIELSKESKQHDIFMGQLEELIFEAKKNPLLDLLGKKRIKVKAAVLESVNSLLLNIRKETLEQKIESISKCILPLIDEKERLIQSSLWRGCLLTILEKCPPAILVKCDLKMVETKTFEVLKRAASGIGKPFYLNVALFLSKLPMASFAQVPEKGNMEEFAKEKLSFIKKFFEALLGGFEHDEIKIFGDQLVQAYLECVYFVSLKRLMPGLNRSEFKGLVNVQRQARNLIRDIICNIINIYLNEHISDNFMGAYKAVPSQFAQLLENLSVEQFGAEEGQNLFSEMIIEFSNLFTKVAKKDTNRFTNYLSLLQSIATVVTTKSLVFVELDSAVQKMHQDLLSDLKNELKPLMNDSHIDKILPICTQYKQYANLFQHSQKNNTSKPSEEESLTKPADSEGQENKNNNFLNLGIFTNLMANQTQAAVQTIGQLAQSIVSNIKTISHQANLEKFTTFVSQIYYSWADSILPSQPEYLAFQQILIDVSSHIKMLNQIDPKALLHLSFVFHFALPDTSPGFFTSSKQKTSNDESNIIKTVHQLDVTIAKSREQSIQLLRANEEFQKLALNAVSHVFAKMDKYLGQSMPLIVTIYKHFLNAQGKQSVFAQVKANINKKLEILLGNACPQKNIGRVLEELDQNYLFCILILKKSTEDNNADDQAMLEQFKNLFKVAQFCVQKKLKNRIIQSFKLLKHLINNKSTEKIILQSILETIETDLKAIFIENNHTNYESFIKLLKETLSFLKLNKKKEAVIEVTQIVFHQDYFSNCIVEGKNWHLMHIVFEEIFNYIDLNAFLKDLFLSKKGFWLIACLLSSQQALAIINQIQIRKYFRDFTSNFIRQMIILSIEDNFDIVIEFLKDMANYASTKSLAYGNALKVFLKQTIVDGITAFKQTAIFDQVIKPRVYHLFEIQDIDSMMREGILIKNLLPLFKEELDRDQGYQIQEQLQMRISDACRAQKLEGQQKISSLIALDILMASFQEQFYSTEGQQIQITEYMLSQFCTFDSYNEHQNYITSVFFSFLNTVVEKKGLEIFVDSFLAIENHLRKALEYSAKPRKFSSNALIAVLSFLRKVVPILEGGFSSDFKDFTVQNVMDTCLIKLSEFQQQIEKQTDSNIIDESNDIVIVEFAETISRFVTVLSESFDENLAYELLNSAYPAIQKSAFLLLKQFYVAFSPQSGLGLKLSSTDEDFEEQLLKSISDERMNVQNLLKYLDVTNVVLSQEDKKKLEDAKKQLNETVNQDEEKKVQNQENIPNKTTGLDEEILKDNGEDYNDDKEEQEEEDLETENKDIIDPSTYGHLLTWISLVNKLNAPSDSQEHEFVKTALKLYLEENKLIHKNFLTVLFQWIEFLEIPESEQKDILTIEEVQSVNPEWSDFLSRESLFQLLVQSLYVFSSKFPFFLRHWLENTAEKRFIKLAENLIKNFVSNALYLKEVETIELSQTEWQSEEFTIFVTKKTREINAVYTKEGQKLEINMKIPLEYPIKHIQTEVKRGMKVNQQKTNKWMLMMKSLLFNQNNTIKNALLMWKHNLDKELEGLEECAICYYVINSTSGELPKLPCKTCKKKFHSSCIHKWFKSSNKSECPLCKSQFL